MSLKHPKEMYYLSFIEMCQRFAFWGIANLLVIYLVQFHHFSDVSSTKLYGLFTAVAFILPVVGGYIADRTSYFWAIVFGSAATALGCFLIATGSKPLLYISLLCAAIGTSVFTPSIFTILGSFYHNKHHLREGGFSIYYSAVNLGAFIAVFTLGTIGQAGAWGVAFTLAGCVQLFGLYVFIKNRTRFVHLHLEKQKSKLEKSKTPLKKEEKDRIIVICVLSFISIFFWTAYNQGWSSMSLFVLRFTDRTFDGFTMPSSWLLSLDPLYLVLLAFPMASFYLWLRKKKTDPTPPMKTALSLVIIAICFGVMILGSRQIAPGATRGTVSPFYPAFAYLLMAIGEMLLAPIGLSLVTHLSPKRYTAFLVGVWYVCVGISFYLAGWIAGYMSKVKDLAVFFSIFFFATLIVAGILLLFVRKLNQMRHVESS